MATDKYKFTCKMGPNVTPPTPGAIKNAQAAMGILRKRYSRHVSKLRRVGDVITFVAEIGSAPLSPIRLYGGKVELTWYGDGAKRASRKK